VLTYNLIPSLRRHDPDQVRGYHLSQQYLAPLEFAAAKLQRIGQKTKISWLIFRIVVQFAADSSVLLLFCCWLLSFCCWLCCCCMLSCRLSVGCWLLKSPEGPSSKPPPSNPKLTIEASLVFLKELSCPPHGRRRRRV